MTSHQNLPRTLRDAEIRQTLREFRANGPLDYRPVMFGETMSNTPNGSAAGRTPAGHNNRFAGMPRLQELLAAPP